MKKKPELPLSIRPSAEDVANLDYLTRRLGSTKPQVIRLALRRLKEQESAIEADAKIRRTTR